MPHINLVNDPSHNESLVAQLVRAPNRYLGGHGFDSRPGLRNFSLSHARVIVEKFVFINTHCIFTIKTKGSSYKINIDIHSLSKIAFFLKMLLF